MIMQLIRKPDTMLKRKFFLVQSDDDDADNKEGDDDKETSKDNLKDDDELNCRFSNGSSDEQANDTDHDIEMDNRESSQRVGTAKPLYNYELQLYGWSNTIALDVQFIKGVLPDLFAIVLKFLEGDEDLVFNGIICHYFLKKLQVVESKQHEWWKWNCQAVWKSINGRCTSVSNLIKCAFMGKFTQSCSDKKVYII